MIYEFIEKATKEFEQNGRSKRFVAMENKIIEKGNPLQAYYFARYAKGADASRLQPVLIENAPLDVCWFFQLNVPGSDIEAFVKKAVYDGNSFWIKRFVKLKDKIQQEKKKERNNQQPKTAGTRNKPRTKLSDVNLDALADKANREYLENGASKAFLDYEREVLYSEGLGGNQILYLKSVKGANLKAFERVALLNGSPFHMYLLAKEFDADKALMLQGIRLAKLDHVQIENDKQLIKSSVDLLTSQIEAAVANDDQFLANRLREQLRKKEAGWCYLDHVNMYEAEISGMLLSEVKK